MSRGVAVGHLQPRDWIDTISGTNVPLQPERVIGFVELFAQWKLRVESLKWPGLHLASTRDEDSERLGGFNTWAMGRILGVHGEVSQNKG